MAGSRREPAELTRRIYFYRLELGRDDDGHPVTFNAARCLRHIHQLPFTDTGRYWQAPGSDAVTCAWVDRQSAPQRMRFGNVRRSALPQLEQSGRISSLNIPLTSGIVELVHVVFFPENILAADFNFYGPRMTRLGDYLAEKCRDLGAVPVVETLLRRDAVQKLRRLEDIRLLQLKVRDTFIEQVEAADADLGAAFRSAKDASDAQEVELVLTPRAYSRGQLSDRLKGVAQRLMGRPDIAEEASKFHIAGMSSDTGAIETIDLLNDKLIAHKAVLRQDPRSRVLDPTSAFRAIEDAYDELQGAVRNAAGLE